MVQANRHARGLRERPDLASCGHPGRGEFVPNALIRIKNSPAYGASQQQSAPAVAAIDGENALLIQPKAIRHLATEII
jgi:hypothetical protein